MKIQFLEVWAAGKSQYAGHKQFQIVALLDGVRETRFETATGVRDAKSKFRARLEFRERPAVQTKPEVI